LKGQFIMQRRDFLNLTAIGGGAVCFSALPWDASAPYKGLGWREVHAAAKGEKFTIAEFPAVRS